MQGTKLQFVGALQIHPIAFRQKAVLE